MLDDMDGGGRRADELCEQFAALKALAAATRAQLGDLAGRVADTQDEVARVHEEIAAGGVSVLAAQAGENAVRAHRFAEHERREQKRMASTDQGPESSG